tara:strand:+ start:971 stop:2176 length:1206 start_codon:yes stop_codon:yes gene_type:complete
VHFKKNLLQTRLSFILAIMLVNSCASTSNNDFKLLENQKQENFPELLSINDLFVINELNEDKAKNERELILELLKYESLDTNEANKLNAIIPSTLKPYGKRIIEGILQNNKKLQNSKSTNLNIKINEEYKNILISASTNIDTKFNLIFTNDAKYNIDDDILNKTLPGFCNSFQVDQLNSIEKVVFSNNEFDGRETLIIYESNYKNQKRRLEDYYSNVRSVLFTNENYDQFASNVLGVSESSERYSKINALLPNININNTPRVRQDIKNIYFLMSYRNAKGLVPAFRYNYSIGINSYASINLIENVNNINMIADFESLIMPISNQFGDTIYLNQFKNNASVEDRLIFDNLHDFLLITFLSKNGINEGVVNGRSGILYLAEGKCTKRKLPLKTINSDGVFTLP